MNSTTTLWELNSALIASRRRRRKRPSSSSSSTVRRKRHCAVDETLYCLVKRGTDLSDATEIARRRQSGTLVLRDLWIWRHKDTQLRRNRYVPLFEATWRCAGRHILAQKRDLAQVYSERRNGERARETLADGTPYWVDRYIYSTHAYQHQQHRSKCPKKEREREPQKRKRGSP